MEWFQRGVVAGVLITANGSGQGNRADPEGESTSHLFFFRRQRAHLSAPFRLRTCLSGTVSSAGVLEGRYNFDRMAQSMRVSHPR